jgi:hypothetical protein
MKKYLTVLLISLSSACWSGEWIHVGNNLRQIEVAQAESMPSANEGVYFMGNAPFVTQQGCTKSLYITIADEKLADRALSMGMFAIASDKTLKVYVDGCDANNYILGKVVLIAP